MSSAPTKTLLIVDDSRVSRMMIRTLVTARRPHWAIQECETGDEALDRLAHGVPDYVTMDINMPGTIGTDVAERILQAYPQVRMAVFSANVQAAHQARAAAMGACFVPKPVNDKSVQLALKFFDEVA
jgi:two-component system chemotaxis response regulator CheY